MAIKTRDKWKLELRDEDIALLITNSKLCGLCPYSKYKHCSQNKSDEKCFMKIVKTLDTNMHDIEFMNIFADEIFKKYIATGEIKEETIEKWQQLWEEI